MEIGPFLPLRAFQSLKRHLFEKMDVINDTKTPKVAKSAKEMGIICDSVAFV